MATVKIRKSDFRDDCLPLICAVCGEPATCYRSQRLVWAPPWLILIFFAGLVPLIVCWLVLRKTFTAELPACDEHEIPSMTTTPLVIGGVVTSLVSLIAGIVFVQSDDVLGGVFLTLAFVIFFGTILIGAILGRRGIKANEITDSTVTIRGLNIEFVEAVREELWPPVRRRRRVRRYESDD